MESGGSRVEVAVGGMRVAGMAVAVVVGASVGADVVMDGAAGVSVLVAGPVVQETSQTARRIMLTTGGLLVVRFFMGCSPNDNALAHSKGEWVIIPLERVERSSEAPEASALSAELQGHAALVYHTETDSAKLAIHSNCGDPMCGNVQVESATLRVVFEIQNIMNKA